MEKLESVYTIGGNVKWCSRYGNRMEIHQKLKVELTYDPAIPLCGIYPKELKSGFQEVFTLYNKWETFEIHVMFFTVDFRKWSIQP